MAWTVGLKHPRGLRVRQSTQPHHKFRRAMASITTCHFLHRPRLSIFRCGANNGLHFTVDFSWQPLKSRKPMNKPDSFDNMIDAAAEVFALNLEPAWKPGVRANLQVFFRQAAPLMAFELPDDTEPAPIFKA
jgi:Protein of unknown function (DUF4089)